MQIAYIRVSIQEQNTVRQEVSLQELGVEEVYIDRMSGKNTGRPELQRMMEYVRRGDTVVVESISRFARNTRDLLDLVEQLTIAGVEFASKKEAIDTTTPSGKFMLTIFAALRRSLTADDRICGRCLDFIGNRACVTRQWADGSPIEKVQFARF